MIYLAQPYTHKRSDVVQARFKIGEFMTWYYMKAGEPIFSPIVMCHKISRLYEMPTDFAFWMDYDYDIISNCDQVRVLKLPGWDQSVGVKAELEFAEKKGITVRYAEWDGICEAIEKYRDKWGENHIAYFAGILNQA